MGFLLFAARKLQLKREINTKNYELMTITAQYNDAQKRVAEFQQTMSDMKSMMSIFSAGIQQQGVLQALHSYADQNGLAHSNQEDFNSWTTEQKQAASAAVQVGQMAGTQMATAINGITDGIFSSINKVQLAQLQAQQNTLDVRKESLESELQLLQGEYQSVKEAEKEAVKSAVPQFGLA